MLEDYELLGQHLIDVLDRAPSTTPLDAPWREARAILLARVECDLRTVLSSACDGYPLQALTLASSLFEHAQVAAFIGIDDERARNWQNWSNEWRSFPNMKQRELIEEAMARYADFWQGDIQGEVDRLQGISRRFGAGKHGLQTLQRAVHTTTTPPGLIIRLGPSDQAPGWVVGRFAGPTPMPDFPAKPSGCRT
jgi:hypothetical protein